MSAISTLILLKGGIVLQHTVRDEVDVLWNTDLLIEGDRITAIGANLDSPLGTIVLDCSDKIISPGFIDTHHHVWQTQLKGRHTDHTIVDYTASGNWQPFNYKPRDIFWGELGGLLEAIDGCTTCVVDHAHMAHTPDHAFAGYAATVASSIRSTFCLGPAPRINSWDSHDVQFEANPVPDWFLPTLQHLIERSQASPLISVGLGFDAFNLTGDEVKRVFTEARAMGTSTITSHWRRNNVVGSAAAVPRILQQHDLLGKDIILSHGTGSTDEEFNMLHQAQVKISCTPATESQMAHGEVVGFREDVHGSLGADCHSNNPGNILDAMKIGLAVARSHRNSRILAEKKFPKHCLPTTLQAFNLATIRGARAINRERDLGSLAVGKQADIVILDATTPAMACAVEHDPVTAVVRHAGVREVDSVIVAGNLLKKDGVLLDVSLPRDGSVWEGLSEIVESSEGSEDSGVHCSWANVRKNLVAGRRDIQSRMDKYDMGVGTRKVVDVWAGGRATEDILA